MGFIFCGPSALSSGKLEKVTVIVSVPWVGAMRVPPRRVLRKIARKASGFTSLFVPLEKNRNKPK